MNGTVIDARGLSCPEPVLLTKQALEDNPDGDFSVMVSSATARDNVLALLERSGFSPGVEEKPGEWVILAAKK